MPAVTALFTPPELVGVRHPRFDEHLPEAVFRSLIDQPDHEGRDPSGGLLGDRSGAFAERCRFASTSFGIHRRRPSGDVGALVCTVCPMIIESLDLTAAQFAAGTGWDIKPQGACKAEVCVPLDSGAPFGVASTAHRLGMAVVHDEVAGLWAIGPESFNERALVSAEAPELVLNDINGHEFRLSSLRGRKVVLVAWSPY